MKNDTNIPMVSVIMGVYNCEKTLETAIDSVINQTYQDFEFIICDDGSTDKSYEIIEKYSKKHPDKIISLRNDGNRGLNYTLNHCLKYAKGKYIARMDGDDECLMKRFETQIDFLESHPKISILGTSIQLFDDYGMWGENHFVEHPTSADVMQRPPFCHPTCMVRREAFEAVDGYSEGKRLIRVEDYHLWVKMYSKGFIGVNLPEILYLYRDDRDSFSKRKFKYRINYAYVTIQAIKLLNMPKYNYIKVLRPILVGLLPYGLYNKLHKWKLRKGAK